jgi:L-threonylcarbamoyladenylate synthase
VSAAAGGAYRCLDVRGFDPERPDELAPALAHLRGGGLLAYPTETVYGLGGAAEQAPLRRLLALKGRGGAHPVLLLVAGPDAVPGLVWTHAARELAEVFWPGAVTLVLSDPAATFPPGVRSSVGGVAVRQSAHPVAAALVRGLGAPITSTSANAPGEPPARTGGEAVTAASSLGVGPDELVLLDGGLLKPSAPSTVVDCTASVPRVLREGAVPLQRLRCVVTETHAAR